jgi:proteasome lid subunit RPN8/RPN11
MTSVISLRRADLEAMVAHALEDAPVECCGFVARIGGRSAGVHRARNVEASPYRFSIDPREYMRLERALDADGLEVAGLYHSHTGTPAVPSPTDIRAMMGAGFTPPFVHFVVGVADPGNPDVRAWHIEDGERFEQEYEIVE